MGFNMRKSINLGGGTKLNIGKTGVGISSGVKGARISTNTNGTTKVTASIPGTGLSYTKNLSKKQAKQNKDTLLLLAKRDVEIINECGTIMNETTSVSTFFSRRKLYMEKLTELSELSKSVKLKGDSPEKKLKMVQKNAVKDINEFIDNVFNDCLDKISTLKRADAKKNRCEKFKNDFSSHESEMEKANIKYYKNKYKELIKEI